MALRRDLTARITDLLRQNPQGLSITEIVKKVDINRNTAGRYLDNLLISGQVEMRHFGMAKIYTLSQRLPVSSVLSLSSEFVMQVDTGLRVVFLNRPFAFLMGTDEKEILGKNIEFTRIPPFFDDRYPPLLNAIREGLAGTEFRGEMDLPSCNRSYSYRVVPIVFTNSQKGVSVIFDDITDRKQSETLLKESEEKFRTLVNNAGDMITLHGFGKDGLPGKYIEVNEEACRRLRYSRDELLARSPKDIIAPECAGVMSRNARALLESGHATFEVVHLAKDGQRIPVEISTHVFEFHGEHVALAIVRDITLRKQAEDQLRLMKISIDSAYDEVFWMDMEAHFFYANDAACRVTGYSQGELYAMKVYALDPDFTPERWKESIADLRKNKKQFFQTRHRRKDGVILDVEIASVYVTRGRDEYAFCFVRDITERKRIEAALRESETWYRSLAEASQDMIFVIDREDQVLYINQQAAEFIGMPAESVTGKPRSGLFPPEVSDSQYGEIQYVFSTGLPMRNEGPMTTPAGEVRWFDHALMPILDDAGQVSSVMGVSRDVTKRIAAERERRQDEESSRFIAEHSVDIIHRLDPQCTLLYTSPSVTTLLGYSPEEVLGRQVLGMIHPEDLPCVMQNLQAISTSGQDTITSSFRFRHKDGHYILFESTTRIIRDAGGQVREFLNISRDISGRRRESA